MWNETPSIPWKRKLTLPQHRAVYSKSLPLPVGGAESVSCFPQKRRHLFIVKSHRWEQLVDVYCGALRACSPESLHRGNAIDLVERRDFLSETEELPPSPSRQLSRRCRASTLLGIFGFVMTAEQGSVMLTFDLEEWTTGQECRVERSTETFTSPSPAFNQRCNEQDSIDNFTVYWN